VFGVTLNLALSIYLHVCYFMMISVRGFEVCFLNTKPWNTVQKFGCVTQLFNDVYAAVP